MKRLSKILLCAFILSSVVTAGLLALALRHHCSVMPLINSTPPFMFKYEQKEDAYPYAEAVKKGELDLKAVFKEMLPHDIALVGHPDRLKWVASPVTIHYYKDTNDIRPVFTIEKGTYLLYKVTSSDVTYNGIQSMPANKAGWRIAKPFIIADEEPSDTVLYVKTEDLIAVSSAWFEENSILHPPKSSANNKAELWNKYNNPVLETLFFDRLLFSKGIYLSPDLMTYLFPPAPLISLSVSAVLLAAYLFVKRRLNK